MSAKNRLRRKENRSARTEYETREHRRVVQRNWAIAACVVIALPLTAFGVSRGVAGGKHERVVVGAAGDAAAPGTQAPATTATTKPTPQTVLVPSKTPDTVIRRVYTTPATSSYVVVPQVNQQQVTARTAAPTTIPIPKSKPCVASKDTPPGGTKVPVPVGPAPTHMITRDLVTGTGPIVKAHTTVTVNYIAVACSTGKIIDASYQHGGSSTLKLDDVIPGWQLGMPGAKVGGTRLLGVPAVLAYGSAGRPPIIGANEALWFQVQVLQTNVKVGPPSAPTNVAATAGAGKAEVSWSAPLQNGAPVSQYVLTTYTDGVQTAQQTAYTTANSMSVTSLQPGKSYTFKVAARNSYGLGAASAASNAVVPT
jgi:peptidylprolyl isomerase